MRQGSCLTAGRPACEQLPRRYRALLLKRWSERSRERDSQGFAEVSDCYLQTVRMFQLIGNQKKRAPLTRFSAPGRPCCPASLRQEWGAFDLPSPWLPAKLTKQRCGTPGRSLGLVCWRRLPGVGPGFHRCLASVPSASRRQAAAPAAISWPGGNNRAGMASLLFHAAVITGACRNPTEI